MPRKANLLWTYFTKLESKEQASCNKCKQILGCKKCTTSALRHHLKAIHPVDASKLLRDEIAEKGRREEVYEGLAQAIDQVEEVMEHGTDSTAEIDNVSIEFLTPPAKKQKLCLTPKVSDKAIKIRTMSDYYPNKYTLRDRRQLIFDMEVTKFLARASLPFSLVESDAFKDFVASLNPRLNLKSRKTIAGTKLTVLCDNLKSVINKEIKKDLDQCDMVSFTSDCWTSRSNDPYISLTLHYINEEFILKRWALGCENFGGKHTGVAIAREFDRMINEIPGLKKTSHRVIVHDAAANMKVASTKSDQINSSMICFDHQINTSLAYAVKASPDLLHAINMATTLTARSHQSSLAAQAIKEECRKQEVGYVKLITPVKTRWNSNQMMIESILRMRSVFEELYNDQNKDIGHVIPSQSNFILLEQILPILTKMKTFSEDCSVETRPSSHLAVAHLFNISHFLTNELQNDTLEEPIKLFLKVLLDQLTARISIDEKSCEIPRYAHFLHPFFKGALLKHHNCFESTKSQLIENHQTTKEFKNKTNSTLSQSNKTLIPGDEAERMILEFSEDEATEEVSQLRREIDLYLTLPKPVERSQVDVLQWWKQQQNAMPLLARLARGFFLSHFRLRLAKECFQLLARFSLFQE